MRTIQRYPALALAAALTLTLALALGGMVLAAPAPQATNLLRNPSFEGVYTVQDGKTTLLLAPEWGAFFKDSGALPDWAQQGASSGPIRQPEYKAGTRAVDARRVRTGDVSQVLFTFYAVMLGGVRQTVVVEPGEAYQAGAFVQAWTDNSDDPCKTTGQMVALVGIDPYGGSDPWARQVQWGKWYDANPGCSQWFEVKSPVVIAQSAKATVFIFGQHRWALKHGDLYVEDAWMAEVAGTGTCPTPEPTATPVVCPVITPCPACPTPVPGGTCPNLDDIRNVVREECRFTVNWPQ